MRRGLLGRLFSAMLMLVMASGGGSLPTLDGLLFHSRERAADASQAHWETTSGCHSDGCTIRSTAHQARFAPSVGAAGPQLREAEARVASRAFPAPLALSLTGQPLSRAPPFTS